MEGGVHQRREIHCVLWHAPDAPPAFELTALLAQRGLTLETCDHPYAAAARVCRAERAARAARRSAHSSSDADIFAPPDPDVSAAQVGPSLVLLLAEPSTLPMRDAIARVLELHAPRTICWVYQRHATPALRTVALGQLQALGVPESAPDLGAPPPGPTPTTPVLHVAARASTPPATPTNGSAAVASRTSPSIGAEASTVPASRREPGVPLSLVSPAIPPPPRSLEPQVPINTASLLSDEELAMLLADDDPPKRRPRTTS